MRKSATASKQEMGTNKEVKQHQEKSVYFKKEEHKERKWELLEEADSNPVLFLEA